MSIEELIAKAFIVTHIRSKTWGFSFNARDAYVKAYYCQRSLYDLTEHEDFQQAKDTKLLRAYLGMKDQEAFAIKQQLSRAQMKINEVLG